MYKDPDYAGSRLDGTVVRLKGEPVFVNEVHGDMTCTVTNSSSDTARVDLDDLNVSAPPLGFINHGGRAIYIARKPIRNDYRQGVRPTQLIALKGDLRGRLSNGMIMRAIKGHYNTLEEAVAMIEGGEHKSVALSRDLCLESGRGGSKLLCYKWYGAVGKCVGGKIKLTNKNNHLVECLKGVVL